MSTTAVGPIIFYLNLLGFSRPGPCSLVLRQFQISIGTHYSTLVYLPRGLVLIQNLRAGGVAE